MSFTKIQQALNQAMVAVLPSAFNTGKVLYLNSFMPWVDIAADHKRGSHRSPSQSPVGSATAHIVQAVGLKPLKAVELERDIRQKLKVAPRTPLLSNEQLKILQLLVDQIY